MQIVGVNFWSGPHNINILSMIYRLLTRFLLILYHKHIKIFAFSTTSYLNTQTALINPPNEVLLPVYWLSKPRLLMPWQCKEPGHQELLY